MRRMLARLLVQKSLHSCPSRVPKPGIFRRAMPWEQPSECWAFGCLFRFVHRYSFKDGLVGAVQEYDSR